MIACNIKIPNSYDKTLYIHGCVKSDEENKCDYCDKCIVQNDCPYEYKRWSK